MKALTVVPGISGSAALADVLEPPAADGSVLVETLAIGVCGTDAEIVRGEYGQAPPGDEHLVLGHESLGRVLDAPSSSGLQPGEGQLVVDVMANNATCSIVCLTGVSSSRVLDVDVGAMNRSMVLENDVVFGSVNANRSHYEAAAAALAAADRGWLGGLITRRVPLAECPGAIDKGADDIKVVIELA